MKKIINFFYEGEPLEINLREYIKKKNLSLNRKFIILLIKIFRITYKNYQRIFLKPSNRKVLKSLEKIFFHKKKEESDVYHKHAEDLKRDGVLEVENIFSQEELEITIRELSENLLLQPIYTSHKDFYLHAPPKDAVTGYINTETLLKTSFVLKAAHNEKILNILQSYFDCKFKLDWVWGWWSFPNSNKIGPQMFHRDYESMNFIKVFTYLTDVDLNNGPHEIIIGSHKIDKLYKRERFSDEDVLKNFDSKLKKTILGKKGKTFLADTFALHRGLQPMKNSRLVLVFLYSVVPSNRSPKIPFLKKEDYKFPLKKNYINQLFVE